MGQVQGTTGYNKTNASVQLAKVAFALAERGEDYLEIKNTLSAFSNRPLSAVDKKKVKLGIQLAKSRGIPRTSMTLDDIWLSSFGAPSSTKRQRKPVRLRSKSDECLGSTLFKEALMQDDLRRGSKTEDSGSSMRKGSASIRNNLNWDLVEDRHLNKDNDEDKKPANLRSADIVDSVSSPFGAHTVKNCNSTHNDDDWCLVSMSDIRSADCGDFDVQNQNQEAFQGADRNNPLWMARFGLGNRPVYTRTVSHAPYQYPGYMFEVRWDATAQEVCLDRWEEGIRLPKSDPALLRNMFSWLSHETWLWLVMPDGTFRFAPEHQRHRSSLLQLRDEIICHGDLAMPTDGSMHMRRGPAVFGGELNWTTVITREASDCTQELDKDRDGLDIGVVMKKEGSSVSDAQKSDTKAFQGWCMDNRSSYVANRATGILKTTFLTVLLAGREKALGVDTMYPMARLFKTLGVEMEGRLWLRDEAGKFEIFGRNKSDLDDGVLELFPFVPAWQVEHHKQEAETSTGVHII